MPKTAKARLVPWRPWHHAPGNPSYIYIYISEWGRDPRPISSLGALDGGSDRDRFVSVVCRLSVCLSSVCPPPATHPRPTPTNGSIHGSIQDRSRIDPGFYQILHDFTYFSLKSIKYTFWPGILPLQESPTGKQTCFYYILHYFT